MTDIVERLRLAIEHRSAALWERVIADLIEIEKRTGGRDKSPTTAIIETCRSDHV
jgi:hypothetical protein